MKTMRLPVLLLVLLALSFTPSCGHLDQAGVYQGDKILYDADLLLPAAYTTIHEFVTWEKAHRGTPLVTPSMTVAADKLRANSKQAFKDAWDLRTVYEKAKTAENRTKLQNALIIVRQLLSIAVTWTPNVQQTQ